MKAVFFVREVIPEGGVALATFRLASALVEAGAEAEVLYCDGEAPSEFEHLGRRVPRPASDEAGSAELRRSLERAAPSLVVIGTGDADDLRASLDVAPTLMHAHLHLGTCADTSRYWYRLKRPCTVRAGVKCAALRPILGCNDLRHSLQPGSVAAQQSLLRLLIAERIGVLCVSTDQAELYIRHGVAASQLITLPNLGIRKDSSALSEAAEVVPPEWRSATTFIGRLSKTKGGELLNRLAEELPADSRLRVFGDGYLGGQLSGLPDGTLCGQVPQQMIAGVLMWARSVVFPSLWPEPGGIVGIDAQVMGVPLAAFDIGAARYWPKARTFERTHVRQMTAWLAEQDGRHSPRDPDEVADAQTRYWQGVASLAVAQLSSFAAGGNAGGVAERPVEHLMHGPTPAGRR